MAEMMTRIIEALDRRKFLRRAATAGGALVMGVLGLARDVEAACGGILFPAACCCLCKNPATCDCDGASCFWSWQCCNGVQPYVCWECFPDLGCASGCSTGGGNLCSYVQSGWHNCGNPVGPI